MKVDDIFAEAVKIEGQTGRKKYLDEVCADNPRIRARVEELLAAHGQAGSFLEPAAGQLPVDSMALTEAFAPAKPIAEGPGSIIGRYKLLQQIGEGGMGVVYMAEQEQPVRRRVALKIIKPGMDSTQVIARFEAERQALAMMDHPNIAHALDAGCTDTGRPFFVMELVQGIPITKYCDDKQLDTHARLELFVQVCHAVQHAHQKGIIHRDIKPSNILLTIYDSKPVPKIIDFGVAKALHQRLTEATMFTHFGAVVGTLEYMSPEQAEMDALGMDTRSDIYSLGVLLYELLTGTTPMDGKKLRSLGYAEMLKTIREVDPPRPSTQLTRSQHDMATISAKRHTEPRRLQRMIAGDLDWIVMKCLEKDRTRRYETANGLAMDIQRHLNDEAVVACPPGNLYKLQKLVRRNKLVFTAIGCVMMALVIGLAASLWQAGRASREAMRARMALNDLRAAAPSIATEARALAAQEKFNEAIGKLDYAAQLRPDAPEYLLAKADLLETQLRLTDAASIYRAALKFTPDDARAKANAELCDQLAAAPKTGDGKLSRESLSRLNAQMLKDQRPAAEIMPVARLLGDAKKYIVNYWIERLKDLPNGTDTPLDKRLTMREDGLLDLNLGDTQIADLSPLAGMPLGTLNIPNCKKVTDLSPLRGMPLTKLSVASTGVTSLGPLRGMSSLQKLLVSGTQVSDLSPLAGLPLNWVVIDDCPVTSLTPLRGMPLEKLFMRSTAVTDLSPLAGMPLKTLDVSYDAVTDFTPLTGLPLEICYLQGMRVGDLAFLRGVPLKQLALTASVDVRNLAVLPEIRTLEVLVLPGNISEWTVEDFAAVEKLRDHPSLKQLAAWFPIDMSLENIPSKDKFWKSWDRDFGWALRLRKAGFTFSCDRQGDGTWYLSIIPGTPAFSDLSLLRGASISQLYLNSAKVTDLTPLQSMPLTWLALDNASVSDLTPLRGLKLTSYLGLAGTPVHDLSPLRGMPLESVDLRDSQIKDVSPLADIPTMKSIILPVHATNIESLRKLPNLKKLSFRYDTINGGPAGTTETFWKTWDGLPWARKLEAAGIAFNFEQMDDGYYDVTIHDAGFTDCSIFKGSNVRRLDLQGSSVADLSPFADLPLQALDVRETRVTDLSPLRSPVLGNALRQLRVWKTNVKDFSPIAACPNLELFDGADTALPDLSVFKGMKLRTLLIGHTGVTDIALVAGMPLEKVDLVGCHVTDISPLLKCPTLKDLVLPRVALDVESLRALPKLANLSYAGLSGGAPDKTASEFWANHNHHAGGSGSSQPATQPSSSSNGGSPTGRGN